VQAIGRIQIGNYKVSCILLIGLFFYDIFWVFGTDVMVTVAKNFDAPVKLMIPKAFFANKYSFSMLGLGDIVLPGVFIAFLLRFDSYKAFGNHQPTTTFPKTYFNYCFISYFLGLVTTIIVMHTFQAAQPALLYLTPACIISSLITGFANKDFNQLFSYEEGNSKEKKDEKLKMDNDTNGDKPSSEKTKEEPQETINRKKINE